MSTARGHLTRRLPVDVKKKYRVVITNNLSFFQYPWGHVNLTKISLKKADELVSRGFPYLVKK